MDRRLVLHSSLAIPSGHRLDVTEHIDETTGASSVLSIVDLVEQRLPNAVVFPALGTVAVLLVPATWAAGDWLRLLWAVIGASAMFAVYLVLALISPSSMGMGDVKLALVIGQSADLGAKPRRLGNVAEEFIDRLGADHAQHLAAVGIGKRQIAHALAPQPRPLTKAA